MDFIVVIHRAEEGGFWGEVPALEGCFVQGESIEEVLHDAPQAIASHLDALRADGRPIPRSHDQILIATVSAPLSEVA